MATTLTPITPRPSSRGVHLFLNSRNSVRIWLL
jgi:hypothetical protein